MRFMDKILSLLGFDIEEDEKLNKKVKPAKSFDKNLNLNDKKVKSKKRDFFILSDEISEKKECINLKPKNQTDIQSAMNLLKNGKNLVINLEELNQAELISALGFILGFCYSLNVGVEKVNETSYKLTNKAK